MKSRVLALALATTFGLAAALAAAPAHAEDDVPGDSWEWGGAGAP